MVREHTDAYSGARIALRRKNSIVFSRQRRRSTCRQICESHLNARLALPVIERNAASRMNTAAAVLQERPSERLTNSTESDRIHKLPIA